MNRFAGDSGEAPERLIEALRRFAAREMGQAEVLDALRDARLLVPLVARAGEMGVSDAGLSHDKTQELSLVTVTAPDGRVALPAFTSTKAMARWNSDARPIPVDARRVALAAAAEHTPLIVLDATSETEFALRPAMVRSLAEGSAWQHPAADESVMNAFENGVSGEGAIHALRLGDGDPTARLAGPDVLVELALAPGLDQAELERLLDRVRTRWRSSSPIAESIDSLGVRLVNAE